MKLPATKVLALQGGGALGAYQIGVYQALHEHNYLPDLVVGVSIGAINSAIIVGNRHEDRIDKLNQFWSKITRKTAFTHNGSISDQSKLHNLLSAAATALYGQNGFFQPNFYNP